MIRLSDSGTLELRFWLRMDGASSRLRADVVDDHLRERSLRRVVGRHVGQQRKLAHGVVDLADRPVRLVDELAEPGELDLILKLRELLAELVERLADVRDVLA